jgi:hypothetical protein
MLLNRPDKQGQSRSGHPNLAEAPSVTAKKFLVWHAVLRLEGRLHLRL